MRPVACGSLDANASLQCLAPRRIGEHVVADGVEIAGIERLEHHERRTPGPVGGWEDAPRNALRGQDVALHAGLVAGPHQPEKADPAQPGEIGIGVERAVILIELRLRYRGVVRHEERLRRRQQRQVEVDAALDAVERIIGCRLEFQARGVLHADMDNPCDDEACQRQRQEYDGRKNSLQSVAISRTIVAH